MVFANDYKPGIQISDPAYLKTINISPSCVSCSGPVIEKLNAVDVGLALMVSALLSTEVYFSITREIDTHENQQAPAIPENKIGINHPLYSLTAAICLSFISLSGVTADTHPDKYYLRIAHGIASESNELNVTSLGVVSLKNNMVGHVDLAYLDSDTDGKAAALDFGAGLAFNWYLSPYLSIGASLGYNWDKDEAIAAYFPEVGVVVDFSRTFGMTISGRRYYSLYEQDENIIMLGLVFRK